MATYQYIQNYFSKLNPLAEKIAWDVNNAKSAYGHLWLRLSSLEQETIINDTLINPEVSLQYKNTVNSKNEVQKLFKSNEYWETDSPTDLRYSYDRKNLLTYMYQNVGLKTLHDENIGDYRDEHSSPFCFKTKSQINIAILKRTTYLNDNDNTFNINTKIQNLHQINFSELVNNENNTKEESSDIRYYESIVNKDQLNLIYVLGSNFEINSTDEGGNTKEKKNGEKGKVLRTDVTIPKGFDFLSNW